MKPLQAKYFGGSFEISNKTIIEAIGQDCERFFQGQLTGNVSLLKDGYGQLSARLDRTGKLQTFFYLIRKSSDHFFILIDAEQVDHLMEDLNKFIIMDDVELKSLGIKKILAEISYSKPDGQRYAIPCLSEQIHLDWSQPSFESTLDTDQLEGLEFFSAQPVWNKTVFKDQLLNETILSLEALDLKKGCFLGQETVAKIEVGRGASYFPVCFSSELLSEELVGKEFKVNGRKGGKVFSFLERDGEKFIQMSLFREFRIFNRELQLDFEGHSINGRVSELPLWESLDSKEKAQWLYEEGSLQFQNNDESLAIKLMQRAIDIDSSLADAYEALGVILGRHERYEEAISLMDRLLEVDNDSVMAHTNKSLYLMKLGKIEEAEEEKAHATVKGFSALGKESQKKKELEALREKEQEELLRRKGMFEQVLEIDAEDTIANYGMADILFKEKNFAKALPHLEKVLEVDEQYSVAWLLLGKTHLALGQKDKAKDVFRKGIAIASKRGDLMPANEMQAKLASL